MTDPAAPRRRRFGARALALAAVAAAVVTLAVVALLVNIFERKQEARNPFYRVVDLTDDTEDPAVWGRNFPQQYDAYLRTVDQQRTRYGGSEAIPRTPSDVDPRSIVAQSRLEEDPRLKILWAGYAFSKDFREERGHEARKIVTHPVTCIDCAR
jgi:nitrite reductase (cytochrome c-552)